MVICDVVLMALISAAIVGFLVWSIFTQHRDYGAAHLRIRRPYKITARLVTLAAPEPVRKASIPLDVQSNRAIEQLLQSD